MCSQKYFLSVDLLRIFTHRHILKNKQKFATPSRNICKKDFHITKDEHLKPIKKSSDRKHAKKVTYFSARVTRVLAMCCDIPFSFVLFFWVAVPRKDYAPMVYIGFFSRIHKTNVLFVLPLKILNTTKKRALQISVYVLH